MNACPARGAAGRSPGFTLMEMLVTLVLISFATMLMFQMLGSYRIASERVRGQAGHIDRQALFQSWFRDSVHGLYAAPNLHFIGDAAHFSATTLNPLYAPEGSPIAIGLPSGAYNGFSVVAEKCAASPMKCRLGAAYSPCTLSRNQDWNSAWRSMWPACPRTRSLAMR